MKITKVTRKGILLDLYSYRDLDLEKSLLDFFDAENLESYDGRFKNMSWDYWQHRINNSDWEDDWFMEDDRLNLFWMSDDNFIDFLCYLVGPEKVVDYSWDSWKDYVKDVLWIVNDKLMYDNYEVVDSGKKQWGIAIYTWKSIVGWRKEVTFYTNNFWWDKKLPYIYLSHNNWDDFWWKTTFKMRLHVEYWKSIDLWLISILNKDENINKKNGYITFIPNSFKKLWSQYCSIISSDDSISKLNTEEVREYKQSIVEWLREATFDERILAEFKDKPWFSTSLLRSSEAFARVQNIEKQLLNFSIEHFYGNVWFSFEKDELPYRISCLIGKNGCWKTTLLAELAKELVEYDPENTKLTRRPSFSKVIQISYSIFDTFNRPDNIDFLRYKYIYCWLQDCWTEVTNNYLEKKVLDALDIVSKKSKWSVYIYLLRELLDNNEINIDQLKDSFNSYSSWQKILITILAEILANIDENSILLFDEPETYLHPNMIFKLISIMYELLDDNNSYLILATHSPIVIQQIPSKYVNVIDKSWNKGLTMECFGENFSELTKEIFGSYESEEVLYKDIFKNLVKKKYTEDWILELFDGKLNLSARIYLKALFNEKK